MNRSPDRAIAVYLSGVDKYYGAFQALSRIDLEVRKGEKIVICGPSGSGKSTLIRCINRLEPHDSGCIVGNGIELTSDPRSIEGVRLEVGRPAEPLAPVGEQTRVRPDRHRHVGRHAVDHSD